MPAFGQGPLKQGRSGRSNFIAGFVRGCPRNQGSHAPVASEKTRYAGRGANPEYGFSLEKPIQNKSPNASWI